MKTLPLILLLSAVPVAAASADDWQDVKSYEGNFRCQMPGEPAYQSQDLETEVGKSKMHLFIVEQKEGAIAFIASYNDYPVERIEGDPEKVLEHCKTGNLESFKAKATQESQVKIGDHVGLSFRGTGESDGQTVHGAWQVYLVGTRLYQFAVVGIAVELSDQDVKKFFDSFRLLKD